MAELKCGAVTCMHNDNHYCCRGDIMVGGKRATKSEETFCDSFANEKRDAYTSALEHPSRTISIDCEATQCSYNSNYKCVAKEVEIRGCSACDCRQTSCATFQCHVR